MIRAPENFFSDCESIVETLGSSGPYKEVGNNTDGNAITQKSPHRLFSIFYSTGFLCVCLMC